MQFLKYKILFKNQGYLKDVPAVELSIPWESQNSEAQINSNRTEARVKEGTSFRGV